MLLFPPSWHPSQPYLSLPSLTAFLKQNGVNDVVQRDLNIELLDILLTQKTCGEFYHRITDKLRCLEGYLTTSSDYQDERKTLIEAVESLPWLMNQVERAKNILRSDAFYNLDNYMEAVHIVNESLRLMSSLFYPSTMTAVSNAMRFSVYSSNDIMQAIHSERENIFLSLYKEYVLSSLLEWTPKIIGISITNTSQIIPGLTLARLIKEQNKETHITIGGSVFTKLIEELRRVDSIFSLADSFIVFEGEHALLELCAQVDGKNDLKKVPNLVYRENGVTKVNDNFFSEDLNILPTPDFNGFPLNLYFAPSLVLPIQTSRGCYYRKCAFCNLHLDHRNFRLRRTDLIMEDIRKLSREYKTNFFFFTDESVPINKLREISQCLLENRDEIKWMGGVRFEKALTGDVLEKMAKAGCLKLVFGLESYNQRVLDKMKKGTRSDVVKKVLDECLKAGISFHLYVIVGFPTETEGEALETLHFVMNEKYINSAGYSCLPSLFGMEKDSPIVNNPSEYGLTSIRAPKGEDMGLGYLYEVKEGMSPGKAEEMYRHMISKLSETLCPFPYNYSMADGLLYLAHRNTVLNPDRV
ncbi:MAG: radical SAM protein [Candidatus Kuenenia sp.]|nr:radical SAM protein [Candidatus Kuenenia hertensis]